MIKKILQLGHDALYKPCEPVQPHELKLLRAIAEDMHDTLLAFRHRHGYGQGITAPQIGVRKRMLHFDMESPIYCINPLLIFPDDEMYEVTEYCLSFPGLLVKTKRYRHCILRYRNLHWLQREVVLQDEMAALAQHTYDHLDGMLAPLRAANARSLVMGKPNLK